MGNSGTLPLKYEKLCVLEHQYNKYLYIDLYIYVHI